MHGGRAMTNEQHDDKNVMLYMLAGVGLGALIGAAAGLLFAPKSGSEVRHDLADKFKELKGKTEEWVAERRAKKSDELAGGDVEQIGA
ncbi:MAG TPA: YtxH domain-containing protein [Fimbriimonadaceae bacterium]|nr:YtxH domain-containing protein [Fimbriimonadaceae bacterium]